MTKVILTFFKIYICRNNITLISNFINMEKRNANIGYISNIKIISTNEKRREYTPKTQRNSSEGKRSLTSGNKKRVSDRFIPTAIKFNEGFFIKGKIQSSL